MLTVYSNHDHIPLYTVSQKRPPFRS